MIAPSSSRSCLLALVLALGGPLGAWALERTLEVERFVWSRPELAEVRVRARSTSDGGITIEARAPDDTTARDARRLLASGTDVRQVRVLVDPRMLRGASPPENPLESARQALGRDAIGRLHLTALDGATLRPGDGTLILEPPSSDPPTERRVVRLLRAQPGIGAVRVVQAAERQIGGARDARPGRDAAPGVDPDARADRTRAERPRAERPRRRANRDPSRRTRRDDGMPTSPDAPASTIPAKPEAGTEAADAPAPPAGPAAGTDQKRSGASPTPDRDTLARRAGRDPFRRSGGGASAEETTPGPRTAMPPSVAEAKPAARPQPVAQPVPVTRPDVVRPVPADPKPADDATGATAPRPSAPQTARTPEPTVEVAPGAGSRPTERPAATADRPGAAPAATPPAEAAKPPTRSAPDETDAVVEDLLRRELRRLGAKTGLQVQVRSGVVSFSGRVADHQEAVRLREAARNADGVVRTTGRVTAADTGAIVPMDALPD